jgi:hypothetical protein
MTRVRTAAVAVLVLLAAFVGADVVAMALYPGGTFMDPSTVGHRFWGNFLCDLARQPAVDGRPNTALPWGRAALALLFLAGGAFWLAVPGLFRGRAAARFVVAAGMVSTVALLSLALGTTRTAHLVGVLCGAGPGLAAAAVTVWALRTRRALFALGVVAALLCAADVVLYVRYFDHIVLAVPLVQRLALLSGVSFVAACAFTVLYEGEAASAAGGAGESGSPRAT